LEELIELIQLLDRSKMANGGLELLLEHNSKMLQLYFGIVDQSINSDRSGARLLYPTTQNAAAKFQSLKNKLKKRLIQGIFMIDLNEPLYSSRQNAYLECSKKWAAASILMAKNAKKIGIDICEKLLKQTIKFEFTELTISTLRFLRLHYSTVEPDLKKFEEYHTQIKTYKEIWQLENKAEGFYSELVINYLNNKSIPPAEIQAKAIDYYLELEPFLEKNTSLRLYLSVLLIRISIYTVVNDYASTMQVCEDGLAYFEKKVFGDNPGTQVCMYQLLICAIQLKDIEKGKLYAAKGKAIFQKGDFNWYKFQGLLFLLAMHSQQYNEAYQVYIETSSNEKFGYQPPLIQETWRLNQAYLFFVSRLGKLNIEIPDSAGLNFKPGKFINDTPVFSKDKRKKNIPILIIQILLFALDHDYNRVIDKMEAIEKYRTRYLKTAENFRSNCFLHMITRLPTAHFNPIYAERITQREWSDLTQTPLDIANQSHEIEIIPYEDLWPMILNILKGDKTNKFQRVTNRNSN
jgi:hypothetical protein